MNLYDIFSEVLKNAGGFDKKQPVERKEIKMTVLVRVPPSAVESFRST